MALLKFFFIVVLIVFALGFVFRMLLGRAFHNFQKNMHQQYRQNQQKQKKEGEVTIQDTTRNKNKKKFKDDQGDYIDYEEVE